MSTQDASSNGGSRTASAALKGEVAAPACPECHGRMAVRQVTPVLFASDFDDVVFGCEKCGSEIKRTVKRSPPI